MGTAAPPNRRRRKQRHPWGDSSTIPKKERNSSPRKGGGRERSTAQRKRRDRHFAVLYCILLDLNVIALNLIAFTFFWEKWVTSVSFHLIQKNGDGSTTPKRPSSTTRQDRGRVSTRQHHPKGGGCQAAPPERREKKVDAKQLTQTVGGRKHHHTKEVRWKKAAPPTKRQQHSKGGQESSAAWKKRWWQSDPKNIFICIFFDILALVFVGFFFQKNLLITFTFYLFTFYVFYSFIIFLFKKFFYFLTFSFFLFNPYIFLFHLFFFLPRKLQEPSTLNSDILKECQDKEPMESLGAQIWKEKATAQPYKSGRPGLLWNRHGLAWMKIWKAWKSRSMSCGDRKRLVTWNWRVRSNPENELDAGSGRLCSDCFFVCFFMTSPGG